MGTRFSPELLKGSIKKIILAVLSEGELHGYGITKEIEKRSGDVLHYGEGSLYPALHALEHDGLLKSHWTQHNGRDRKSYSLTTKGRRALALSKGEWKEFSTAVQKVLGIYAS